ncbi:amino acid adenylation domain-containing protein [Candidatus Albibeggiatoa sp. nov. NOAA]|uniref:amino acid adenylation domain-containing protein n=1 Tax=Candidatus Albibeggiatoa sp. nov. NOAA TaxID=3162724 RepID=UPI003300967B|nr:amino acid adenylation domain-containing protein [Thiotrichaceae bacterium]
MLSQEHLQRIASWNQTSKAYPHQCLHQLIESQVQRTPNAVAVSINDKNLTYMELNRQANQLARHLVSLGIHVESLVGICAERSLEMVVGLLAILKAGAAYLPLDPDYPQDRLSFMLDDAQVSIILTQSHISLPTHQAQLVDLNTFNYDQYDSTNLNTKVGLDNLAYVIYTSGSTGKPKGAMNTHLAISNRLLWMQDAYGLNEKDKILQKTPFSFDVSVWEFFWPLMTGAQLVMAKPKGHQDPQYLAQLITQQKITTLHFVPSMLRLFLNTAKLQHNQDLQRVFCSGEALPVELQNQFLAQYPNIVLHNLYGPTEAAVDVSFWQCQPNEQGHTVSIGKPISNLQLYILDEANQPVAIGETGELHIAGIGLARGYLHRPELTEEKFIQVDLPFSDTSNCRLYKTGDLARYREDGNIEFLGRIDHQVKIRGFRIELGEIEASLNQHPAINKSVVTAVEHESDTKIAAYTVPEANTPLARWLKLQQQGDLAQQPSYELLNGMTIIHQNKAETDFIYQEIFAQNNYLKHGICIPENATIVDVGANIGLFSLYAAQYPQAKIYAFEPIPPIFNNLSLNSQIYNLNTTLYACGLSDENTTANFTYYPHASLISGQFADKEIEKQILAAYLQKYQYLTEKQKQAIMEESLLTKRFECELRTLSSIIAEQHIQQIDLLKIDVEKSELLVLKGIESQDWAKIQQIVIEIHNIDGRLSAIQQLLTQHQFELVVEQDSKLQQAQLYTIYAKRQTLQPAKPNSYQWASAKNLAHELRHSLSQQLPEYMLPTYYHWLLDLPLNPNGKTDRQVLPQIDFNQRNLLIPYVAAQNEKQSHLVNLWQELLNIEKIGINDNFFELGGHSLLAVQMLTQIQSLWTVELTLHQLFSAPTIVQLAELIGQQSQPRHLDNYSTSQLIPLSYAQKQQWFICQLEPEKPIYNEPMTIYFNQAIDDYALEKALNYLLQRHSILRTRFQVHSSGQASQSIAESDYIELEIITVDTEQAAQNIAHQQATKNFDLQHDLLITASLIKLSETDYRLYLSIHHILLDGVSFYHIFLPELYQAYQAFSQQQLPDLADITTEYKDFALWQYQQTDHEADLNYWKYQLQDLPVLQLPTDFPRPKTNSFNGKNYLFELDSHLVKQLKQLAQQEGVTLFMLLITAFAILLHRYTGQTDIPIGTVSGMRQRAEFKSVLGLFLNTLVLRTNLSQNPLFSTLLQQVKITTLQAYQHQKLPFNQLVEQLKSQQNSGYNPLFQVMFDLDPEPDSVGHWQANHFDIHTDTAKFDLTLEFYPIEGQLKGRFEYNTDLFTENTISSLARHLQTLLTSITQTPLKPIAQLNMLTSFDYEQFKQWNQTVTDYPRQSISDLFEQQAVRSPNAIALQFGQKTLTYAALNQSANQLAHYLIQQGVKNETLVGICIERSFELIIGLLAIVKAGGCYVPFDPQYPKQRLDFMLEDTGIQYLLTHSQFIENLPITEQIICIDDYENVITQSVENPDIQINTQDLAYIMYTSGSTGQPKGVGVPQQAVVRLVKNTHYMPFSPELTFLQLAPISFDASTWEIWGSLLNGAKLVIAPAETPSLEQLGFIIQQNQITALWLTAGLFHQMVENQLHNLYRVHYLLAGGDVLSVSHVQEILQKTDCTLINGYGPTENTTFTCCYAMDKHTHIDDSVLIGQPIANTQIFVLDQHQQPVPAGVVGELYIAGDGLAREYFNRPTLTQERFVHLSVPWLDSPQRAYKTGDLVRYHHDGNVEFLGRTDYQVKLRGFRIELGEIEAALQQHSAIQNAIVTVWEQNSQKYLIAYYIANKELDTQQLRDFLQQQLPHYMLPQFFIAVKQFHLNPNGKVDRQALPKPEFSANTLENHVQQTLTATEQTLVTIWKNILPIQDFTIHDDFFKLGGHSLLATQVISRINQAFNLQMPLRSIFETATIKHLAKQIDTLTWMHSDANSHIEREEGEL